MKLRQSTAVTFTVGPVLDADGVAVTTCVIGDFKLSKAGAAYAAFNGSATLTHAHTGHYRLAATATDTGTVGGFEVIIDKTTDACPPLHFQVIEEAIYDAMFAASANAWSGAAGSSIGAANMTQLAGSTAPVTNMNTVFNTDFATNYNTTNDGWVVKLGDYDQGGPATVLTFERMIGLATTPDSNCVSLTSDGTGSAIRLISPAGTAMHVQSNNAKGMVVLGGAGSSALEIGDGEDSSGLFIRSGPGGTDALRIAAYGDGQDAVAISAEGGGGRGILCTSTDSEAAQFTGGGTAAGLNLVGGSGGGHGLTATRGSIAADDVFLTNSDAPTLSASVLIANSITSTVIADDAITDAKIAVPAETAGRPTRVLAMLRRTWEWMANKRIRTRSTGVVQLRDAADNANLETATQSTAGGVGAEVDTQSAGS